MGLRGTRRYAENTKVPSIKTRTEIEQLLIKRGATQFMNGVEPGRAVLFFVMLEWRVRFDLPLPVVKRGVTENDVARETRRRWRALLLVIKAKLEAVASGIVEFRHEFLAHIVTNGTRTVGDQVLPNLAALVSSGKMPPLLGPPKDMP